MPEIKRALISVFHKEGIVDFAKGLTKLGIEILSTGGTARALREAGIRVREVSRYTHSPAMLGGRVKTLHPRIHAALLAVRDAPDQMREVKQYGIELIDMVVVNLYPFQKVVQKDKVGLKEARENIDIGGPTMLRAAAKNFPHVAAVTSPDQYPQILKELEENRCSLSEVTCLNLAMRVFQETSAYDALIAHYLEKETGKKFPHIINLSFKKQKNLRYGENPHQEAAFYREWIETRPSLSSTEKLWGKDLSFNNLLDLDAALAMVSEFREPAVVVIKHTNPCGVGCASHLQEAFKKAYSGDPVSAFGSIIGLNKIVDAPTAGEIASSDKFIEAIIAPDYEDKALEILKTGQKWGKNLRVLKVNGFLVRGKTGYEIKGVRGGILFQERDEETYFPSNLRTVTKRIPTQKEQDELLFAWTVCKHVKSNAIVLSKDKTVVGVGAGQMSRVDSSRLAIGKAGDRARGACLASDAFFPFPDAVEEAGKSGITALIQPGGSLRDQEIIAAADRYRMAMMFTGMRHFKH
ncbi:MAG: bifunctional phosphoribosylaminoimidazolecarboxamide formyltransferase/IMP cyclohydrolase [bacterium]